MAAPLAPESARNIPRFSGMSKYMPFSPLQTASHKSSSKALSALGAHQWRCRWRPSRARTQSARGSRPGSRAGASAAPRRRARTPTGAPCGRRWRWPRGRRRAQMPRPTPSTRARCRALLVAHCSGISAAQFWDPVPPCARRRAQTPCPTPSTRGRCPALSVAHCSTISAVPTSPWHSAQKAHIRVLVTTQAAACPCTPEVLQHPLAVVQVQGWLRGCAFGMLMACLPASARRSTHRLRRTKGGWCRRSWWRPARRRPGARPRT